MIAYNAPIRYNANVGYNGIGRAVTLDYQLELNGLLHGPDTDYDIESIEGLDMPKLRSSDLVRNTADGAYPGQHFLDARVITVTLNIWTAGAGTTELRDFATAWNRSDTLVDLTYKLPGSGNRRVTGYPNGCDWNVEHSHGVGLVPAIGEFVCPDPRIFDVTSGAEVLY